MGKTNEIYSSEVGTAVKNIKSLQGKKNSIDTYYEYEKLGQLLIDIQMGKLDKNKVEEDSLYVMGLRVEYEKRYLGTDEQKNCSSSDKEQECDEKESETECVQAQDTEQQSVHAESTQPKAPKAQPKKQPNVRNPFMPPKSNRPYQPILPGILVPVNTNIDNSNRNNVSGDGDITITGNGNSYNQE